jgi:BirA family biotin operon repressor/biotin-[acetyl-CoA-carboxylase] ligase
MATSLVRGERAKCLRARLTVFDEAAVRVRIAATRFSRLRYLRETDSTNDVATRELSVSARRGSIILAEYQRQGRGRRGRRWVAPPGSALTFTAILPDALPTASLWAVPFWSALSVAEGVAAASGVALELQWPNDLLIAGRKVCGILGTSHVAGVTSWAACGVGLNVHRPPSDAAEVDAGAAFLRDVAPNAGREDVFVAIVHAMDGRLTTLADPAAVARAWEERAHLAGTPYRILVDGEREPFEGRALRLGSQGALVVDVAGREREIAMADARVLRDGS